MNLLDFLNPIKGLADVANSIIGRFVADPNEKIQLQQKILDAQMSLAQQAMTAQSELVSAQTSVVLAEAKSDSFLARNWRPIFMLVIVTIIAWNYMVVPITGAPHAELPPDMWTLVKIGVGGYIVGRSGEKIASNITLNGNGASK